MRSIFWMLSPLLAVALVSCMDPSSSAQTRSTTANSRGGSPARCDAIAPDEFVLRTDLVPGSRPDDANLLLRFVQFTDDHIIDDDGQAVNGASETDVLHPIMESAMRLQEEYSDEVLNNMIGRINTCNDAYPSEFAIVTGDSADLTTVAEARRFIDNMDGSFDQISAFETNCAEGVPEALVEQACTRFTGRGVADTQALDPDPESPLYQLLPTRTALQLLNTEQAAITGRAADGSIDPTRQTLTRAPGLPELLRCEHGANGCANQQLAMPWYVAFGNHDGYLRGTLAFGTLPNELLYASGRHYMIHQNEFIDEFFHTQPSPGPVGHGFHLADAERRDDADTRNDGYYAFDAGAGRFRMIVLNTIIDGTDPRLPTDLIRNPAALSDGSIDDAQFSWMKTELAQASDKEQLVVIFSHHSDLTFADLGIFAPLVPPGYVKAADLDGELASWPNVMAWVAGHTHLNRVRAFKVNEGVGSNGTIEAPVDCKGPGPCLGFWQIETASLIDYPQEQRLFEIFDNGNGTGTIRAPLLTHDFEKSRVLAEADDRCQFYLTDPEALLTGLTDGGLDVVCGQGLTRQGEADDRNVELIFAMP